jgi:hypothetical protein
VTNTVLEKSNVTPSPKTTVTAQLSVTVHIPPNDMYLPTLTYGAGTWMWTKKDASTLHSTSIKMKFLCSNKKREERIKSERMLRQMRK